MLGPAPDSKRQGTKYVVDQPVPSWLIIRDTQGAVVAEMARGASVELARQLAAGPELLRAAEAALEYIKATCADCIALEPGEKPGWGKACKEDICSPARVIFPLEVAIANAKGRIVGCDDEEGDDDAGTGA